MNRLLKKVISVILVLLLAFSAVGCGGADTNSSDEVSVALSDDPSAFPLTEEKVTLRFAVVRGANNTIPYSEMPVIQEFEKISNVHIEWEEIDASAVQEKVNLMFSTNNLPDAFFGPLLTDNQVVTFANAGKIVPLNALIKEHAPNMKAFIDAREDYKKAITAPDGNIYALASMFEEERGLANDNLFINKTWLDKLELSVPTSSEEFYTVLKAFKEQDPNGNGLQDEIPFSAMDKEESLYSLFGMFGMPDNKEHLAVQDSKVIYTATQPGYKDAIIYFNRLFEEGLVDPEFFTQDKTQLKAKGYSETPIVGSVMCFWLQDNTPPERQEEYVHLKPMSGPNGDQNWKRNLYMAGLSKNRFAITSTNQNKELTMRWIDYWLDNGEHSNTITHGTKGQLWGDVDTEAGTWRTFNEKTPPTEGMTFGQWRHAECPGANGIFILADGYIDKRVLDSANEAQQERYLTKEPYLMDQSTVIPPMYFTSEQQTRLAEIAGDIQSYTNQKRAEWLTKGGVEEEWDEYLTQLDKLCLPEMLEIYQEALDNFNES